MTTPQYNQTPASFTPPAPDTGFSFGTNFVPLFLEIDNPSSYYLTFPGRTNRVVAPYQLGVIIPWGITGGNVVVDTSFTPAGAPSLPVSNAKINILATDNPNLAPTPGTSILSSANIANAIINVAGSIDANITNASLDVTGTVDLAAGTTVDANITNSTLDITGPVTITQGQGGTNVLTELPDDFTFGTGVEPWGTTFSAVNQTTPILTMNAGTVYSLLYIIYSINPPSTNAIQIQGVSSGGVVTTLDTIWTTTPQQSIIIPLFLVSSPTSGTNVLQAACANFSSGVEIIGSIIYRIGAPANVTPWLT